jgi:hypothetical protein
MKRLFFTAFLFLCCLWLHAQTITGEVYSEGSNEAIIGATVYYGGTMEGTITNAKGGFELRARHEQIPVIVSCIGYYTSRVIYKPGQPLIVRLKPKLEQLKTVTIRANDMDRAEEIRIFTREFIGISNYARSCTITNINDIDFWYNKKTKILTASCDKPLNIVNKKLGYTITYFLDTFSFTPKGVYIAGNYIFKENEAPTAQAKAEIKVNRENAYQFSRMQLIRALWSHKLQKSGFKIYTPYYDLLTEDSLIVRDSLKQQYVKLPPRIIITTNTNTPNSYIIPTAKLVFIDKDGYYGPGLKWDGSLVRQRIGDLLPFEYQSEAELKNTSANDLAEIKQAEANRILASMKNQKKIPGGQDWNEFKNIVLMPDNATDTEKVVRKWQQPIRYKIYGAFNNKDYHKTITGDIKLMLEKLAPLTGCAITQTDTDSLANLLIVIGQPDEFAGIAPPEALKYFNARNTNSCYYAATENGFTRIMACMAPGRDFSLQNASHNDTHMNDVELQELWSKTRKILMKSLGFAGQNKNEASLFYSSVNAWIPEDRINPTDTRIIQTLYNPQVKSGMKEQELYTIVKGMFINSR